MASTGVILAPVTGGNYRRTCNHLSSKPGAFTRTLLAVSTVEKKMCHFQTTHNLSVRADHNSARAGVRYLVKPLSAVGSGLETTITDPSDNDIRIKNAEITVESKDENKMQVRVDVTGKETEIVFEKVLRNLARTAPPVPGFRREKGGKTSKVPSDFLLQILGEDRVTKFVIQEIITSTVADYVKKENLTVKGNNIKTIQTAEELKAAFVPGNDFGFNATLELENSAESPVEVELSA